MNGRREHREEATENEDGKERERPRNATGRPRLWVETTTHRRASATEQQSVSPHLLLRYAGCGGDSPGMCMRRYTWVHATVHLGPGDLTGVLALQERLVLGVGETEDRAVAPARKRRLLLGKRRPLLGRYGSRRTGGPRS